MKYNKNEKVVYKEKGRGSALPAIILELNDDGSYLLLMEFRQNGDVKIRASEEELKAWD